MREYPARIEAAYPESLSRGQALAKWLLAIPQLVIIAALATVRGMLVFIAGAALLVTGRYPEELFELIMGLERWTYRVVAYASLMTDEYPPFRLDVATA